ADGRSVGLGARPVRTGAAALGAAVPGDLTSWAIPGASVTGRDEPVNIRCLTVDAAQRVVLGFRPDHELDHDGVHMEHANRPDAPAGQSPQWVARRVGRRARRGRAIVAATGTVGLVAAMTSFAVIGPASAAPTDDLNIGFAGSLVDTTGYTT